MSLKQYALITRTGPGEVTVVHGGNGETARQAFQAHISQIDMSEKDVVCFARIDTAAGEARSLEHMLKENLIYQVRGLPEISANSHTVLNSFFMNPKSTLRMSNVESRLSPPAREAFDELIEAGLLSEEPTDDGYEDGKHYRLTDAGKDYPGRPRSNPFEPENDFPLTEKIPTSDAEETPCP